MRSEFPLSALYILYRFQGTCWWVGWVKDLGGGWDFWKEKKPFFSWKVFWNFDPAFLVKKEAFSFFFLGGVGRHLHITFFSVTEHRWILATCWGTTTLPDWMCCLKGYSFLCGSCAVAQFFELCNLFVGKFLQRSPGWIRPTKIQPRNPPFIPVKPLRFVSHKCLPFKPPSHPMGPNWLVGSCRKRRQLTRPVGYKAPTSQSLKLLWPLQVQGLVMNQRWWVWRKCNWMLYWIVPKHEWQIWAMRLGTNGKS